MSQTRPRAPVAVGDAAAIRLHPELQTWVYTDPSDGIEYEYDEEKKAWFPMWNEALVMAQQSAYEGNEQVNSSAAGTTATASATAATPPPTNEASDDESESASTATSASESKKKSNRNKRRRGGDDDDTVARPAGNASVYVSGLPVDVELDEMVSFFSKCGMLMTDVMTGEPKIKIYRDSYGNPKGDALVTFFRPESVALAEQLLDGVEFRLGRPETVRVEEAVFKERDSAAASEAGDSKPKVDKKLAQKRLKLMEKKLGWNDYVEKDKSQRFKKIVILKYMFTTQEMDEDPTLLIDLKEDIRQEADKIGETTNVIVYDKSPDGVCSVRFKESDHAEQCVKLMNGRYFGGRQVEAHIHNGIEKYERSGNKDEDAVSASYDKWLTEE